MSKPPIINKPATPNYQIIDEGSVNFSFLLQSPSQSAFDFDEKKDDRNKKDSTDTMDEESSDHFYFKMPEGAPSNKRKSMTIQEKVNELVKEMGPKQFAVALAQIQHEYCLRKIKRRLNEDILK